MMSVGGGTYLRVVAEQLYFDAERETQNVFHAQTDVGRFTDQIQFARTHFVERSKSCSGLNATLCPMKIYGRSLVLKL